MSNPKILGGRVDALRAEIADLKTQRRATETAPRSAAEAERCLAALINQGARRYADRQAYMVCASPTGQLAPSDLIPGTPEGLFDFLCATLGDRIIEQLATLLGEQCRAGLSSAERAQRLAELDAALGKLERAEEKLISEAEAAGLTLLRRADADPAVILED